MSAALLTSACSSDEDPTDPSQPAPGEQPADVQELLAPGASAVGYIEHELSYLPPGATQQRTVPLSIWYPAIDGGEAHKQYKVGGIVELPEERMALDAPAIADGAHPLAVYSHGSNGEGLLGYPYAELFASHGWVVVAPSHSGNTVGDAIAGSSDPFARVGFHRPLDVTATIDWIEDGAAGTQLAGGVLTDRVFQFGHSFGGYTTFTLGGVNLDVDVLAAGCSATDCAIYDDPAVEAAYRAGFRDDRIAAIAPQAPAFVGFYAQGALASLDVPTMLMSARRDITTSDAQNAQPAWAGLDHADDIWVELPDGGHLSFLSICDDIDPAVLAGLVPTAASDGCGDDFSSVTEMIPVLAGYLLGFARSHILDESAWDAVVRGAPLHPDIAIALH